MAKTVQIPEDLFARICNYFLFDRRDPLNEEIICNGLEDKLDKMQARIEYSKRISDRNNMHSNGK